MKVIFNNVSKIYSPKSNFEKIALKAITFEIKDSEVIGIVGPNGSGKSTMASLISALSKQTTGEIKFDELLYKGKRKQALSIRKDIAVTFQNPETQIIKSDLLEEIGLFAKYTKDKDWKSKSEKIAHEFGFKKEDFEKPTFVFSQGNKRKVIIASSIINNPKLIILDEPTNNLDLASRNEVIESINKIKNNKTVVIISHDLDLIWELTDRTIVLNDGIVVANDKTINVLTNEEILNNNNLVMPKIPALAKKLNIKTSSKNIKDFAKEIYARI